MSIFQTRSRSSSSVAAAVSPFHSQSPQHQQSPLATATQPLQQHHGQQYQQGHDGQEHSIDDQNSHPQHRMQSTRPSAVARPQLFSDFFRKYELMIEFTNLRNPHHCPSGLYVMPAADNMNLWFGTLFVHKGYYRDAVFKFKLMIPPEYPDRRPTVHFLSDMFHPLIDEYGQLVLQYQFPQWRPHRDYLFHVLHYIKAVFKKCVLDTVVERQAVNKEAHRMYRQENTIFAKLAQQRAKLSCSESTLYDHSPANNSIRFRELDEAEFVDLKQRMMNSAISSSGSFSSERRSGSLDSILPTSTSFASRFAE